VLASFALFKHEYQIWKDMGMVTISTFGEGKCVWCCTHGEGAQAKFQDGLSGFFCRKHLWEAIKARGESKEPTNAQSEPSRKSA